MEKISTETVIENLQTQLTELESLESVFCNPGEIRVEDIYTLLDIRNFVAKKSTYLPQYLDITVNLVLENFKFELCANMSHEYPQVEPEIFVRNHKLNRSQHIKLNKDLNTHISGLERGEPCIFSAISWLQDNAHIYIEIREDLPFSQKDEKCEKFTRFWIYSHHIYSKTKRREIVDLANRLHINGFCMPGKPGIICVEGTVSDCNEWWQSIKSMNWKKIFCKVAEDDKEEDKEAFLKFASFEEVTFHNSGVKFNHMDMGELYKYLEDHNVGYIFKELFGVDAKSSS